MLTTASLLLVFLKGQVPVLNHPKILNYSCWFTVPIAFSPYSVTWHPGSSAVWPQPTLEVFPLCVPKQTSKTGVSAQSNATDPALSTIVSLCPFSHVHCCLLHSLPIQTPHIPASCMGQPPPWSFWNRLGLWGRKQTDARDVYLMWGPGGW